VVTDEFIRLQPNRSDLYSTTT